MDEPRRVLILDSDRDTLITLQYVLEQAGIDATITGEEAEAWQLLETTHFDLILIGDHPPELNAATIVQDLSFRGICPPVLILRGVVREKDIDYFRWLGAIGVVAERDSCMVLREVTEALAPTQFKASTASA